MFNFLTEALKKPFYSDKEAEINSTKEYSNLSQEHALNADYMSYDLVMGNTSGFGNKQNEVAKKADQNSIILKCRNIAMLPEVDEVITEIANEAIVYDDIEEPIKLNLENVDVTERIKEKMHRSFEKILYLLDFNKKGDELFRQWYVDGLLNVESVYDNARKRSGIQKIVLLSPFNLIKVKLENGTTRWMFTDNKQGSVALDIKDNNKSYFDEQITQITSGIFDYQNRVYLSPLQKAIKSINQLTAIEDSLIIYRISRAPEKKAIYVDTGGLPKAKAEEYTRHLMSKYRQNKVYDSNTGTLEDAPKKISILEDYWFPISTTNAGQRGTRIETLAGSSPNFGSFEDVDYFINKMYKALNVPANRRNADSRLTVTGGIDIEKEELKFFKFILKLRRKFNNLFVDLLKKDLLAKKVISVEDWRIIQEKIGFVYCNNNEYSALRALQQISLKVEAGNSALGLVEPGIISKEWIQKSIFRFNEEEMDEINNDNSGGSAPPEEVGAPTGDGTVTTGEPTGEVPVSSGAEASDMSFDDAIASINTEESLSIDVDDLKNGDIITDGNTRLLYEDGNFTEIS